MAMTGVWMLLGLVGCADLMLPDPEPREGAPAPAFQPAEPAEIGEGGDTEPPEALWIPRGGARMFTTPDSKVRIITTHDGGEERRHEVPVEAGVLFLSDVHRLEDTQAVFELALTRWSSGEAALDERVESIFFDTDLRPMAYVDIQSVEPVDIPVKWEGAGDTVGRGEVIIGQKELPIEVPVRFTRTLDGFRVQSTEPATLSIEALGRAAELAALVAACEGVGRIADEVKVEVDLVAEWRKPGERGRNNYRIPVRPPTLSTRLQGPGREVIGDVELDLPKKKLPPGWVDFDELEYVPFERD